MQGGAIGQMGCRSRVMTWLSRCGRHGSRSPDPGDLADLYGLILPGSVRPSPKSVTFTMEATTAYERLFAVIIPRHGVEGSDFAADWNDEAWIEAGPFVVGEFVAGQLLSLERNEEYWKTAEDGGALPYLDRVIFRFYESAADPDPRLLDGFNSGDIDLVALASAQDTAEPYLALEDAEVTTAPGPIWTFLNFQFGPGNRNAISQNRHLEYRRAVAHAIDREALALERGTAPVSSVLSRFGLASGEDRGINTPTTSTPSSPSCSPSHNSSTSTRSPATVSTCHSPFRAILRLKSRSPDRS